MDLAWSSIYIYIKRERGDSLGRWQRSVKAESAKASERPYSNFLLTDVTLEQLDGVRSVSSVRW